MSAYSDWRCGAIDDDEYSFYSAWEARRDKYLEDKMYEDDGPGDDDDEDEEDEDDFDDF